MKLIGSLFSSLYFERGLFNNRVMYIVDPAVECTVAGLFSLSTVSPRGRRGRRSTQALCASMILGAMW